MTNQTEPRTTPTAKITARSTRAGIHPEIFTKIRRWESSLCVEIHKLRRPRGTGDGEPGYVLLSRYPGTALLTEADLDNEQAVLEAKLAAAENVIDVAGRMANKLREKINETKRGLSVPAAMFPAGDEDEADEILRGRVANVTRASATTAQEIREQRERGDRETED